MSNYFHVPDSLKDLIDHPLQCHKGGRISGPLPSFKSGCSNQTVFFAAAFYEELVDNPFDRMLLTDRQSVWKGRLKVNGNQWKRFESQNSPFT